MYTKFTQKNQILRYYLYLTKTSMQFIKQNSTWLFNIILGTIALITLIWWYFKVRFSTNAKDPRMVCYFCEKCGHKNKLIPETSRVPRMCRLATPIITHRAKMTSLMEDSASHVVERKLIRGCRVSPNTSQKIPNQSNTKQDLNAKLRFKKMNISKMLIGSKKTFRSKESGRQTQGVFGGLRSLCSERTMSLSK